MSSVHPLSELSAYHDGEATPEERATVESHLRGCRECRELLAEYRAIGGQIRRMSRPVPPPTLHGQVWTGISRRQAGAGFGPAFAGAMRWGAVAAVVLLLGFGFWRIVLNPEPSGVAASMVEPRHGTQNVATDAGLRIEFSQPMPTNEDVRGKVLAIDPASPDWTAVWQDGGKTLFVQPVGGNWDFGTTYRVTVLEGARAADGTRVGNRRSWTFSTVFATTPTATPSATPVPTETPLPPTATATETVSEPTPAPTETPMPVAPTETPLVVAPTETPAAVEPTNTVQPTNTAPAPSPTQPALPTVTSRPANTPVPPTATQPAPTATRTSAPATATRTAVPSTPTTEPTPETTDTPEPTATRTPASTTATPAVTGTVPTGTPEPEVSPTAVATATETPGLLATPTATAQPTQTPGLSTTPSVTPGSGDTYIQCGVEMRSGFGRLYRAIGKVQTDLGCPKAREFGPEAVEQSFQNGYMFWRGDTKRIYVFFDATKEWRSFADTWAEGMPESGGGTPPAGLYEPVRGFGKLWREQDGLRERLGWATETEHKVEAAWQDFEKGAMLWTDDKAIRVLLNGNNSWQAHQDVP